MRQLKKILISILIIAILVVALLSMRIQHIEVVNNIKLSDMQIVSTIFDKEIEKNALVLFINDKLGRHKTIDYVSEYTIKWLSPFSVIIEVHEKPSIAFVRRNLKNVYFDRDGVINDVTDNKKDNIIEVSGIEFKNYEKGSKIASKDMKAIPGTYNTPSLFSDEDFKGPGDAKTPEQRAHPTATTTSSQDVPSPEVQSAQAKAVDNSNVPSPSHAAAPDKPQDAYALGQVLLSSL